MTQRTWTLHRDPNNKYGGRLTLGTREVELPDDAVISVTLGERFTVWRTILNSIMNQFVMKQVAKNEGILYAELVGDAKAAYGLTLTVFTGKSMTKFRDSGAHKFAKNFLSWVFYSGKTHAYFLTWSAKGRIPTAEEARAMVKEYGRFVEGGMEQRSQRPPRQAWYEVLKVAQ